MKRRIFTINTATSSIGTTTSGNYSSSSSGGISSSSNCNSFCSSTTTTTTTTNSGTCIHTNSYNNNNNNNNSRPSSAADKRANSSNLFFDTTEEFRIYTLVWIIAITCYINGLPGEFVHDDIPAITINKDVLGSNPISSAFKNDFWGTPMADITSHKSYRPLTIMSFR